MLHLKKGNILEKSTSALLNQCKLVRVPENTWDWWLCLKLGSYGEVMKKFQKYGTLSWISYGNIKQIQICRTTLSS